MYVWWTAIKLSVWIFFKSISFWSLDRWLKFWFTFPPTQTVPIGSVFITLRTGSLHEKVTDLFMAFYCLGERVYEAKPGFEIAAGETVVDLGAHIGSFSLAALRKGARVVAVEPDPANFSILKENLSRWTNSSPTLIAAAVAAEDGEYLLYKDFLNSAKNSLTRKTGKAVKVPVWRLTKIFEQSGVEHCDFLKFDCEGIEYEVIHGLPDQFWRRVDRLVLELHEPSYFGIDRNLFSKADLLRKLQASGFKITVLPENRMHCLVFATRL
jgi:FkbM family methyltransferase